MTLFAQNGIVSGKGKVICKNGDVVEFELQSDPLTQEQAEYLNAKQEDSEDGSNTPDSSA